MIDCIVIGCRHNTVEFITALSRENIPVGAVVTIDEAVSEKVDVSGFVDVAEHLPGDLPVFKVKSYNMSAEEDLALLATLRFRAGFCIGWQRLIPGWFLDQAEVGIFGMHASRHYLPGGRGRSPINWSIIEGAERIHATLFRYGVEADAGDIVDIVDVDITPFDTIHSVQQKCRIAFNSIVKRHYPNLLRNKLPKRAFPEDSPSWYEKRTPESGQINWHDRAADIHNFIRAQTRPYPGAFTVLNGNEYRIWSGHPFGAGLGFDGEAPGRVLERFFDGAVLVQCGDEPLYTADHEFENITVGDRLL